MNCKKCGAPISETDAFCKKCGGLVGFDPTPTPIDTNFNSIPGAIDFSRVPQPSGEMTQLDKEKKPSVEPSNHFASAPVSPINPIIPQAATSSSEPSFTSEEPVAIPKIEEEPVVMPNIKEEIPPVIPQTEEKTTPLSEIPIVPPVESSVVSEKQEDPLSAGIPPVEDETPLQSSVEAKDVTLSAEENNTDIQSAPLTVEAKKDNPILEEPELEIDEIKRSKKGLIIIIIIVLILLGIGAVFGIQYWNQQKSQSEVDNPNISNVEKYRINFQGYRLDIPEDYIYLVSGDKLYISDSQNTWAAAIQMASIEYDTVLSKTPQIVSAYQNSGFTIGNSEEKEISSRKYFSVELQSGDKYALAVYSKAVSNHVFALTAYNPTYTIDYAILENITSILDSAVYLGAQGSITQTSSIDVLTPIK